MEMEMELEMEMRRRRRWGGLGDHHIEDKVQQKEGSAVSRQ